MPVLRLFATIVLSILCLGLLFPTAVAAQEPFFVGDFETGELCTWSNISPPRLRIDEVTPSRGAVGTVITIRGAGLEDGVPTVRLNGGVPWGTSRIWLDLLSQSETEITVSVPGPIRLGTYDVIVRNCHTAVVATEAFELSLPFATTAFPRFVSEGTEVTMTGKAFGTPVGAVTLIEGRGDQELAAQVTSWQDEQISFLVPNGFLVNGSLDIRVTTALGSLTLGDRLTMTGVNDGDETGPSVVNAVAISNTEVLVQFSEAVQGGIQDGLRVGAENAEHYRITGPVRTPTVTVLEADFLDTRFSTVRLLTISQSDLEYTLAVSNIFDLAGNPMAPPDILVDPSKTTFVGLPPGSTGGIDSDGDGLSDASEQRGWTVTVTRTDGSSSISHVTSDPGDPRLPVDHPVNVAARDTDGDGVVDAEEKHASTNPRGGDTDGDTLSDNLEWNVILSDPTNQDTDGDSGPDGFEYFNARTSPILADTDGDQITDMDELLASNRNPRIADLPRAAIRVGEVRLQIDERFTYEDSTGETVTVESNSNSTLSRSNNQSFSKSDTNVKEHVFGFAIQGGKESESQRGAFFQIGGSYQFTNSDTSQITSESAIESQRVHQRSLSKAEQFDTTNTVTRSIEGARIDVDLIVENAGDLAFTISNLEVTVLQPSPFATDSVLPVATLIANSTLITGEPASFSLGPFTPQRGPVLFSSRDVFPNLVEELMKAPTGLLFEVANFTMTDEFGRSWTFANQVARDRTAGIVVDVGQGEPVRHLLATALQRDVANIAGGDYVGGFDADALPLGVPLDFALQDILKLPKNSMVNDGIVAGPNKIAESVARGDDVQLVPPGTTGVGVGTIVVAAGEDGILDSLALGDDEEQVTTGYETSQVCSAESDNAGALCSNDSACIGANATCSGPEVLVRFGSHRLGDFGREWQVLTTRELPAGADFGEVLLKPGEDIYLAFVQDLDDDGIFARAEFVAGSTDSKADIFDNALFGEAFDENATASLLPDGIPDSRDTDRDGLGDFAEIRVGWNVSTEVGGLRKVRSSPRLRDSDGDGLLDPVEMDLRRFCVANDPRIDALCAFQSAPPVMQSDAVAIVAGANGRADSFTLLGSDDVALVPFGTTGLSFSTPIIGPGPNGVVDSIPNADDRYESINAVPPASDPSLGDTDGDNVDDFTELNGFDVGESIRDSTNGVAETRANGDDIQRAFIGNPVRPQGIIILPGPNGRLDTTALGGDDQRDPGRTVQTDPLRRDTDSDLVDDGRELIQGGDPTDPADGQDFRDSDRDGLTDSEESELGWVIVVNHIPQGFVHSNPFLPDSDFDGLPDFVERDIRSNPNNPDTDGDGIRDFDEFADFGRFLGLEQIYPGFSINGTASMRYGTNPVFADTDGDGLTDRQELVEGYRILLAGEQQFRQVFTNPLEADTDFDGFSDLNERFRIPATDATDPDTDDDGRNDGLEVSVGSDPLVPDIAVEIAVQRVIGKKVTGDGGNNVAEMTWWFTTQAPGDAGPVFLTSPLNARPTSIDENGDGAITFDGEQKLWRWGFTPPLPASQCYWYWMEQGAVTNVSVVNSNRTIILREGQSFALNGVIGEIDEVSADCGAPPNYLPTSLYDIQDGCVDTINEVFTFNDFAGGTTGELLKAGIEGTCEFEVQYSIEVK